MTKLNKVQYKNWIQSSGHAKRNGLQKMAKEILEWIHHNKVKWGGRVEAESIMKIDISEAVQVKEISENMRYNINCEDLEAECRYIDWKIFMFLFFR